MTDDEIVRIAEAVAEKVQAHMEMDIRDIALGSIMGEGAIPVRGREKRRERCHGCRIDPTRPLEAGNVMATTDGAIGTLSASEVRDWCSEIIELPDGRCLRARSIKEAAERCKKAHPSDTRAFVECYAPAFARVTRESQGNPGKEPWQMQRWEYRQWLQAQYPQEVYTSKQITQRNTWVDRRMAQHKILVEQALSEGKSVRAEVLEDYPDLAKAIPKAVPEAKKANPGTAEKINLRIEEIVSKWTKAKARNSKLARKDLAELSSLGVDVSDAEDLLNEYSDIERADYEDAEDYSEARTDAWDEFVDSLGNIEEVEEEEEE